MILAVLFEVLARFRQLEDLDELVVYQFAVHAQASVAAIKISLNMG
jgi:hypothetical protein